MQFVITLDQRDFFRKHHYIEFEGLLTAEQAAHLSTLSEQLLLKRLHTSQRRQADAFSSFRAGYDLWRDSVEIKKMTQRLAIAHLASDVFDICPLRIAFDQFLCHASPAPLQGSCFLTDISSIKPLAGAILFALTDLPALEGSAFPLPRQAGSALFLSSTFSIPWDVLFSLRELSLLLVAFAPVRSYYRQETRDMHSPSLKKMGYVYNDQLREALHPILFGKK